MDLMKLSYLGSIKDNVSGLEGSLGDEGSVISLISAFSTDLKEFKLHTVYFGTSEQIKPLQSVGQAAEFKFEPLPVIWKSLPKAIPDSRRQSKVLTAKSMAVLLGQRSGTA